MSTRTTRIIKNTKDFLRTWIRKKAKLERPVLMNIVRRLPLITHTSGYAQLTKL